MALNVYITGKPAFVKKGSSFDFVSENRMFSDADEYTFNISFPLRGCPENQEVFGRLHRMGVRVNGKPFDMHIVADAQSWHGSGVITGNDEVECKVQFLAGRSAENYYTSLEDVYINNLELGHSEKLPYSTISLAPQDGNWLNCFWRNISKYHAVALPWVNMSTGSLLNRTIFTKDQNGVTQEVYYGMLTGEGYVNQTALASWFPRLIFIAEKICEALGYDYDFGSWGSSKYSCLIICNAVPYTWGFEWKYLLPHWTVPEFFRNLEPLIEGSFDIDETNKKIKFISYSNMIAPRNHIELKNVSDVFSTDVSDSSKECKYMPARFIGYETGDSIVDKSYSCHWLIEKYRQEGKITSFETVADFCARAKAKNFSKVEYGVSQLKDTYGYTTNDYYVRPEICYIKEINKYVCRRVTTGMNIETDEIYYYAVPCMLNQFGPINRPDTAKDTDAPEYTIKFIPATIDYTYNRRMLFVNVGEFSYEKQDPLWEDSNNEETPIFQSAALYNLEEGSDDNSGSAFDKIAVAFFPDADSCINPDATGEGTEIVPIIDDIDFDDNWKSHKHSYSLALDKKFSDLPKVINNVKYTVEFLSDEVPDVRSVFIIRGQRYICEKLTAQISEDGISQKKKGVFWRIEG